MGLHVYCIAPAGTLPPPGTTGIGGAAVLALPAGGCCAWYSRHTQPPAAGVEQLRAHDRVVRAAMTERTTPVPMRFNQWLRAEEDLATRLSDREERWRSLLTRFAGTVEMGLRLARLAPPPAPVLHAGGLASALSPHEPAAPETVHHGAGREYLERLRAESLALNAAAADRDRVLAELADLAGPAVVAATADATPDGEGFWRVAHLVRHARLAAYEDAVGELRRHHPNARILLTGPWPPYSFAADA